MIIKHVFGEIPRGVMVIEDDMGNMARLLAIHFAEFAVSKGMKVEYLTFFSPDHVFDTIKAYEIDLHGKIEIKEIEALPESYQGDIVIIDPFTLFITNVSQSELIRTIKKMGEGKKTFILIHNSKCIDEKLDAILKVLCNNFIQIKTDIVGEKVFRSLNLVKLNGKRALNKIIKFTVESEGIQIDTRETIG